MFLSDDIRMFIFRNFLFGFFFRNALGFKFFCIEEKCSFWMVFVVLFFGKYRKVGFF